jgi:hypothetical protein
MTVAALLVSAPLDAQGPARFRGGVELVSLTVTVTDARARRRQGYYAGPCLDALSAQLQQ